MLPQALTSLAPALHQGQGQRQHTAPVALCSVPSVLSCALSNPPPISPLKTLPLLDPTPLHWPSCLLAASLSLVYTLRLILTSTPSIANPPSANGPGHYTTSPSALSRASGMGSSRPTACSRPQTSSCAKLNFQLLSPYVFFFSPSFFRFSMNSPRFC